MGILLIIIICLIGGSAYFAAPLPVQLVLMGINFLVPDPIPYLDEIIMVGGILSKLYWIDNIGFEIRTFSAKHKFLTGFAIGLAAVLILNLLI